MNSIRARLNLITITIFAVMAWFGHETVTNYRHLMSTVGALEESLILRDTVSRLTAGSYSSRTAEHLQELRRGLTDEKRKQLLSDVIQAYTSKDQALVHKRSRYFIESERDFYQEAATLMQTRKSAVEIHAFIGVLCVIFGVFFLNSYIKRSIFKAINRLSRRMMDFLADRYSFQFSEPERNEMGDLQQTFNSLAQRVINNMDELKSLDQAKSEFLNIASHELRTPMTSIKGSLSLLASGAMGPIDPQMQSLLKIADTETDRLIRLINDLLDLAKIEARKLPLAPAWVRWDQVLENTAAGLTGLAHKAAVGIVFEPFAPIEANVDKDRMQQVLTNLVSNAIKFSPPGAAVLIRTRPDTNGHMLIEVQDHGPGIAAEDQDLIFQKFRQGTNAENPIVKGTGLGLAIAKALVEEHGGTIGVRSRTGQGSVFYFTIPEWRKIDRQAGTAA